MRKTTADRLTSADINHVIRFTVTDHDGNMITNVVGVLVGIEENLTSWGESQGEILHIGVKSYVVMDSQGYSTEISFPEDD